MNSDHRFSLEGKTVVVTGGAGWIGSALCKALGTAGARVYIVDINADGVERQVSHLREAGIDARGRISDTIEAEPLKQVIDEIAEHSGRLDVLVNCAYATPAVELESVTDEHMQEGFRSATAYFVAAKQAAGYMDRGGSIVNIGSMYGQVPGYPDVYKDLMPPNPLPYQASKAAVQHITRYLAVYWANRNIRVNTVAPGPVPNPSAPQNAGCTGYEEFERRLRSRTPLHRLGTPDDMAGPVVFFASDASSFVTGQTLFVDGGWTVW
jgi:gluconate 5-dehydrogenase